MAGRTASEDGITESRPRFVVNECRRYLTLETHEIMAPQATVVITTRNRKEDLRRAIQSCLGQDTDIEVLVFDDASTDGTSEMVQRDFPKVRLITIKKRSGLIVLRSRGFWEAQTPIVFSIDDDARFTDPSTVREALKAFTEDATLGALALRYTEPNRTARQGYMREVPSGTQLRNYIGCAHAIRVDVAKKLGGYREYLVHQGEERDLSIRMLHAGYSVRYLNSPPIVHEPSPIRDHNRLAYLGHRNTFLFDVINVPFPNVVGRLSADVLLLLKHRITLRTFPSRVYNTFRSLVACLWFLPKRAPVSRETYRLYKSLPMHGAVDPRVLRSPTAGVGES
jgi:glycosyltransferase involved in cell wall biosynthesis